MTQADLTKSSLLPDVFSSALVDLFNKVQPGIVQVKTNARGGGTGVVWGADGRIITNNHVVPSDQMAIQVHFSDGRTLAAKVLQRNPRLDLALLKVEANDLSALQIADSSQLRVGEWAFAIGHPWGQRWTLTAGVISTISTVQLSNDLKTQYIKSDVRLAPGNSGGPLLDADGRVVGINAMIFGGDLSVSIPSDVVTSWLSQLSLRSSTRRVTLGIEAQTVELPTDVQQPARKTGVLVVGTSKRKIEPPDLLVGDIILDVEEQVVTNVSTLRTILAQSKEGQIKLALLRGGKKSVTEVAVLEAD